MLDAPAGAVAPGQAAVLYDGERVLGGGWIRRPMPRAAVRRPAPEALPPRLTGRGPSPICGAPNPARAATRGLPAG